ncbi:hypothetical protein IC582_016177 [Cucumis melo]
MARVMIHVKHLPIYFWAEALNTACYIHNRVCLRSGLTATLYELWKGRKLNVKYFHIFDNTCFILSNREHHRKWDSKADRGIFLGYSTNSQAYRVYNRRTRTVMESVNVIIDDHEKIANGSIDEEDGDIWAVYSQKTKTSGSEQSSLTNDKDNSSSHSNVNSMVVLIEPTSVDHLVDSTSEALVSNCQQTNDYSVKLPDTAGSSMQKIVQPTHIAKNHPSSSIIGDVHSSITTQKKERKYYSKMVANVCYTSTIEPTTVTAALTDEHWILAMQEELLQFERNQIEGLDFGETFTPVARLEAIRLLLSYAYFWKFKLFQMDVKSAFLNGYLSKEVYIAQPKGFVDPVHRDNVYKLRKALYGLKQAPRAWYDRLSTYLLRQGYRRGSADQTMFVHRQGTDFLIFQIYVDDIIFGGTSSEYVEQFFN